MEVFHKMHVCAEQKFNIPVGQYGCSIEIIEYTQDQKIPGFLDAKKGDMWMDIMCEYETQINFCPFCGKKAEHSIGE